VNLVIALIMSVRWLRSRGTTLRFVPEPSKTVLFAIHFALNRTNMPLLRLASGTIGPLPSERVYLVSF